MNHVRMYLLPRVPLELMQSGYHFVALVQDDAVMRDHFLLSDSLLEYGATLRMEWTRLCDHNIPIPTLKTMKTL
jgi:hypothetical protein